jgi:hypothetical protein
MPNATTDRQHEARLRRAAARKGVALRKSRRWTHTARPWFIIEPSRSLLLSSASGMTLAEIEELLVGNR